jgi:hypothetical protein
MAPHKTQKRTAYPRTQKTLKRIPKERSKAKSSRPKEQHTTAENLDSDYGELITGRVASAAEVVRLLEQTVAALAEIDDFEKFFLGSGLKDAKMLKKLGSYCSTIANILPSTTTFSKASTPSTIEKYNSRYVLRAPGRLLYVMRPEEVFQGRGTYKHQKVLSWIEEADSVGVGAAIFSLPGYKMNAEYHPRLLDPVVWQKEVKRFAHFYNYNFDKSNYDDHQKEILRASHNEPRLMLAYAVTLVDKYLSSEKPKNCSSDEFWQFGSIYKLPRLGKKFRAVITQTRPPCHPCKRFQAWFEDLSGIEFKFTECRSIGLRPEKIQKDDRGCEIVPGLLSEGETEESDADSDESESSWKFVDQHTIKSSNKVPMIEMRGMLSKVFTDQISSMQNEANRGTIAKVTSSASRRQKPLKDMTTMTAVSKKSTTLQKSKKSDTEIITRTTVDMRKQIEKYRYPSTPKSVPSNWKHAHVSSDDDDDEEYMPSQKPSRTGSRTTYTPLTPPSSAKKESTSFSSFPFSDKAVHHANRIRNEKRKREKHRDEPLPHAKRTKIGY